MTCEVFYAPHTDDESIGMAGSIVRAKDEGHSVMVVLVTDNLPSARGRALFPQDDTAMQRRKEWYCAMQALSVDVTESWYISERAMEIDPTGVQDEIFRRMLDTHLKKKVVHHHTVWGTMDTHIQTGTGSIAHILCANAATNLALQTKTDVTLHGVYVYSHPREDRNAPSIRSLSIRELALKREALDCYKAGAESIGYGYASVPELIDAAQTDPREFLIEVAHGEHSPE